MKEEWRPVVGFGGNYEVSNYGYVRSIDRHITCKNGAVKFLKGRVLSEHLDKKGYRIVRPYGGGENTTIKVARLVGMAFISNPQNKPQINHIDGCKTNDKITNLEWCTNKENMYHAIINGLKSTKLTNDEVVEILFLGKTKTHQSIADIYGVSRPCISMILEHKRRTIISNKNGRVF